METDVGPARWAWKEGWIEQDPGGKNGGFGG